MSPVAERAQRSIILLSGGLDSATVLARATARGDACYALTIDYGQRHDAEMAAARDIAARARVFAHRTVTVDVGQFGGSSLTDTAMAVPVTATEGIPNTYVPARNTIMLAIALAWAEVVGAARICVGVNAVDYSGYPDCRPAFIDAFQTLAGLATKAGVNGERILIEAPLISMSKAEIIALGVQLGVDYSATVSCYQARMDGAACGQCDACRLRKQGFSAAGIGDPTRYAAS